MGRGKGERGVKFLFFIVVGNCKVFFLFYKKLYDLDELKERKRGRESEIKKGSLYNKRGGEGGGRMGRKGNGGKPKFLQHLNLNVFDFPLRYKKKNKKK